jgi:hypothetical protein
MLDGEMAPGDNSVDITLTALLFLAFRTSTATERRGVGSFPAFPKLAVAGIKVMTIAISNR